MSQPLVVALPNLNKLFVVEINAFGARIETILMQEGHPITFISKILGPKHQALSTYERQMLALLYAISK